MVFSSVQTSGLIGGQTAMFSNSASYSQQIGGIYGTGPQVTTQLQNPFPQAQNYDMFSQDAGARMAGAMGMAMPSALMAASAVGGMVGGPLSGLDPFTMSARSFASGVGNAGGGFFNTLGHLGNTFASGGVRAGLGAVGAGIAGAAATALPYYAGYKAVEAIGTSMYKGAQDVAEVGGMANQFIGPSFGAGSRMGGLGKGQIKGIVDMMHEVVGEDSMATMDSLKRLMDRAGQMGMMGSVGGVDSFKRRFKEIIGQTKAIATMMGGTLDEALPMLGQMNQMGLWSSKDIMGTALSAKTMGQAGGAMMNAMGAGAQMSWQQGGNARAGAFMGRQAFMNTRAAAQLGLLNEEQITQYTGGVGGIAGQEMIAKDMTAVISNFANTTAGKLMMSSIGEVNEKGQFTGKIDKNAASNFSNTSWGAVQNKGQKRASSQVGAMSYHRTKDRMGQEMMAEMGIEGIAEAVDKIIQERFGGRGGAFEEEAQIQIIQKLTKADARMAEMISKAIKDLPQTREKNLRDLESSLNTRFQQLDTRMNRSWEGFKTTLGHEYEKILAPFREMGSEFATSMGETVDALTDSVMGRVRKIPISQQQRTKYLIAGAGGRATDYAGLSPESLKTSWMSSVRQTNLVTGTIASMAGISIDATNMVTGGLPTHTNRMPGDIELPGGYTTSSDAKGWIDREFLRGSDPNALNLEVSSNSQKADMETVKSGLSSVVNSQVTANKLQKLKDSGASAQSYTQALIQELKSTNPRASQALERLTKQNAALGKGGGSNTEVQSSIVALAQKQANLSKHELAAKYNLAEMPTLTDGLSIAKRRQELIDSSLKELEGTGGVADWAAKIGALSAIVTTGGLSMLMWNAGKKTDVTKSDYDEVMGRDSEGLKKFIDSIGTGGEAKALEGTEFGARAQQEGTAESKMRKALLAGKGLNMGLLSKNASEFGYRGSQLVGDEERRKASSLMGSLSDFDETSGLDEGQIAKANEIKRLYASNDATSFGQAGEMAKALGKTLNKKQLATLMDKGPLGQFIGGFKVSEMGLKATGTREAGEASLQKYSKQMGGDIRGILSDEQKKELDQMLNQGLNKSETDKIRGWVDENRSRGGVTQGAGGRKDAAQQMAEQLTRYTNANTAFVLAVDAMNGGKIKKNDPQLYDTLTNSVKGPEAP
jgi:hypothetical protein